MQYSEEHWQNLKEELLANLPPDSGDVYFDPGVDDGSLAVEYSRHGLYVSTYITSDASYGDTELAFFDRKSEDVLKQDILTMSEKKAEWDKHDLLALWCHFHDDEKVKAKIESWQEWEY